MSRPRLALALLLVPGIAAAHVRITSPTPRSSTQLKDRHCGVTGSPRANVYTTRPGAPLHLVWDEYVQHPGWFRISFQQHGDVFEIPPPSTGKTGGGAASNYPTEDLTGKTDSATGSLIIADRIPDGTLSKDIVLPNVECNDCTLQLIQVMSDKPPYTMDPTSNDIYFACVDLVLASDAPPPPDAGVGTDPGVDAGATADAGNADTGGNGGGCSAVGAPSALLALAALAVRRRRRTC
jgi:hypothetical protein